MDEYDHFHYSSYAFSSYNSLRILVAVPAGTFPLA